MTRYRIDWHDNITDGVFTRSSMKRDGISTVPGSLIFGLLVLLFLISNVDAATIKVPDDYPIIQAAIDAASPGDTIQVARGTYVENIVLKENVKLEGGWWSDFTARNIEFWRSVIDGGGGGPVVVGARGAVLDGFTIRNGRAPLGGGILLQNAHMTIKHNTIINNSAEGGGGGISIDGIPNATSDTDISDNVIQNNRSDGVGGGIHVSNSHSWINIVNNVIGGRDKGNTAVEFGGGIVIQACSIVNIEGNEITYNEGGAYGGGLQIAGATPNTMVRDNVIQTNHARLAGAGIYLEGGTIINRNDISNNYTDIISDARGGGIWCVADDRYDPKVVNNFIYENVAGAMGGDGIYIDGGNFPRIINNTIVRNGDPARSWPGKGVYVAGGARCLLKNNILWENQDDFFEEMPSCSIYNNNFSSGLFHGVDGNIRMNPQFVDVDDFHILASSPCKDAGDSVDAPRVDIDKQTRGRYADIGADEVVPLTTAIGLSAIIICLLLTGMASSRDRKAW